MGTISPRLARILPTLRDDARYPIIIQLQDDATLDDGRRALRQVGARATFQNEGNRLLGAQATARQIQDLAEQNAISVIWPDEPTVALGGEQRGTA